MMFVAVLFLPGKVEITVVGSNGAGREMQCNFPSQFCTTDHWAVA